MSKLSTFQQTPQDALGQALTFVEHINYFVNVLLTQTVLIAIFDETLSLHFSLAYYNLLAESGGPEFA